MHDDTTRELAGPWKRYFARSFDIGLFMGSLMMVFILGAAVFGLQPDTERQRLLLNPYVLPVVLTLCAFLVEALWYWLFGRTPGKRLFCLHIVDTEKNVLTAKQYATRLCWVATVGIALHIPYVSTIPMLYQWFSLSKQGTTSYDKGRYHVYATEMSALKQSVASLCVIAFFLMTLHSFYLMLVTSGGL